MKYRERIEKVGRHLSEHPSDYQSVISLLKLRSKEIENEIHLRKVEKLKLIKECRERLKDEERTR